jgi:hypothetical protein
LWGQGKGCVVAFDLSPRPERMQALMFIVSVSLLLRALILGYCIDEGDID